METPKPFHIPTIDISAYLNPSSTTGDSEREHVIAQVRTACLTTGFFQLTGHGIPRDLQRRVLDGAAALFALPDAEKQKLDQSNSVGASHRGYEVLGKQALQEGTLPDLKEGFYIGQEIPEDDPRVQEKAFLMGPNLWPPTHLLPAAQFQEPMSTYWKLMFELAVRVLEILAAGLPYGPHIFDEFVSNDAVSSIRLLHYPPATRVESSGGDQQQEQLGAGAHTDFGAITLLLQDANPGLQVWHDEGQSWVDVEPNADAYVVNVGDMLSMWTSDLYKSSLHRVVNGSAAHRYSVPFFFDGNIECELWPLDGTRVDGAKVLTVEGHMKERFATTYGRVDRKPDPMEVA
ncbi:2OG-Fe(II)oxygenase superfamily protein [Phlyctema vagabunda]|uniref:2OG-Fe(II)oxygenase superfamily protein n=1 Tax=Phlyctema vagabunda TaxID=108571 RepID=A0ABR4PC19_9HELO